MTSSSGMKSESRVEALQRMRAVSEAERRGSAAAVEGILTPMFRTPQDEERAAQIDANSEARPHRRDLWQWSWRSHRCD
jgi:hypothetical protein